MKNADLPAMTSTCLIVGSNPNGPVYKDFYGLTKREHFAGLAMQALISSGDNSFISPDKAKDRSDKSLLMADALLAELERTE